MKPCNRIIFSINIEDGNLAETKVRKVLPR